MSAPSHCPMRNVPKRNLSKQDAGAAFRAAPGAGLTGNRARTRSGRTTPKKRRRKE